MSKLTRSDFNADDLWKTFVHTYAEKASLGEWIPGRHHVYLSKILSKRAARGNARVVIHWPPGHGKSMMLSKWYPIWRWENFGKKKFIFATHSQTFARHWGGQITRELTSGNPLISVRPLNRDPASTQFVTDEFGEYYGAGVDGGIIGHRADDFLIDDPIGTADDAFSEKHRAGLRTFYDSVARTRMEPNGNIFMIMQRWHEDDLTSYLIEQGFEYIRLPAIAEEKDPLGRKPGEALWPERFPIEDLLAIRDGKKNPDGSFAKGIPDYFWQAMYQGNPRPMKGRVIDAAWFKRWTSLPENPNEHAIFADFNIKEEKNVKVEGEKNDFTVFEYWVRKGSSCYLVDQVRGVWGITDQVDQFLRFMRKWPRAIGKYLENKANAPAAQNMLKNRIGGIILVEPQGGKIARAMACEPIFKAGNVYIPSDEERNPWIKKYLDEFSGFPGGKHDDQVDTTTLALLHFDQAIPGNLTALINGWKH